MTLTPSQQVTTGSFGAIVQTQHLTERGARRIPAALGARADAHQGPELLLKWGSGFGASLRAGSVGVHPAGSAAFGPAGERSGSRPFHEVGFVDLTRTSVAEATEYAVAGLRDGGTRDGVLIVVEAFGVRHVPLPQRPCDLELAIGTPGEELPGLALVSDLCEPALAERNRIEYVLLPLRLAREVAAEWGGPALEQRLVDDVRNYQAGQGQNVKPAGAPTPPAPMFQVGPFRVVSFASSAEDDDTWEDYARVRYERGPLLSAVGGTREVPLLAAAPGHSLLSTVGQGPEKQAAYELLRHHGLSPAAAVRSLADTYP